MTAVPASAVAFATRYRRQLSFGVVGAVVMAVGFLVLLGLVELAGVNPHVAYVLQAVVSVELSFVLSRSYTWRDRRGASRTAALREWRRFHASRIVSVPANQGLFSLLIIAGGAVAVANVICIALTTVVNWLVGHHLVFGPSAGRA